MKLSQLKGKLNYLGKKAGVVLGGENLYKQTSQTLCYYYTLKVLIIITFSNRVIYTAAKRYSVDAEEMEMQPTNKKPFPNQILIEVTSETGIATPLSLPLCPQSFLSLFTQQLFTSSTFSFPNNAKSEVWLSLRFATRVSSFPLSFYFMQQIFFFSFIPCMRIIICSMVSPLAGVVLKYLIYFSLKTA